MFSTRRLLVSIALLSSVCVTNVELGAQDGAAGAAVAGVKMTTSDRSFPASALELDAQRPELDGIGSRAARARVNKAWKTYARAVKRFLKAEVTVSRTTRTRLIDRAVQGFDSAVKQIERARRKHANEPRVRILHGRLTPKFETARRTAQLELASSYASRGNFNRALRIVEAALRQRPRDPEAKRLREHIQVLLANGFGY